MSRYEQLKKDMLAEPQTWLITGVAGFIGSNLLETLLKLNQNVVGLDNFSTGHQHNLYEVEGVVTERQWKKFNFFEGSICDYATCEKVVSGVDYVLHQAALGSVPRSIVNPVATNAANVTGFLNMLQAAKEQNVKSFTYAASSSTYGDHPALPKVEENIGSPLSPYAVTKYVNELYANIYARTYGFKTIGLRYFNVFGKRQDPDGAYAAVIPKWTAAMLKDESVLINGDGETSRDFCFIENTVQMNILAATAGDEAKDQVYNVAVGDRTTLNELFQFIQETLNENGAGVNCTAAYQDFRPGDVRHSQASIEKATSNLGYSGLVSIREGLAKTMPWYIEKNGVL